MWLQSPFYSMCFWAFDQFCLNSRPVPLEVWVQMPATAAVYHKPRAARAAESVEAVEVVAPAARRAQPLQVEREEAQWLTILAPSTARPACSRRSMRSPASRSRRRPRRRSWPATRRSTSRPRPEASPPRYGVLSIDDELIVYTGKTATQFTGCQRGAFGTAAASHNNGATVKANMVAGFITALQSAVLAIENEMGTAAARNYIRKDGAVTVTGLKTFQDGAEFGAGTKASTGLVRLPNAGAVKWRKQDNSGDLGMALNASNHLAMDAIIDFAAGQTFGASTVPDATTLAKGIVQIDPVGGIAVAAGVISLAASGVGAWHVHQGHRGREGARHGWRDARGRRPARPHPYGVRYRLRRAPVHDPEQRRGGRHPPRVEPDPGREHRPDVPGRARQRPRERHRRARRAHATRRPT